jgi:hypothetical protein
MVSAAPKRGLARTVSLPLSRAVLPAAFARGGEAAGGRLPQLGHPAVCRWETLPASPPPTPEPPARTCLMAETALASIPRRTPGRVRDMREGQRGHPQEDWR